MMTPIALGLVRQVSTVTRRAPEATAGTERSSLHVAMLLGTAYAGTVGGVGTLIGTPSNAIVCGTGDIGRERMLRAGLTLDLLLALVTTGILLTLVAVGFPGVA